MWAAKRLERKRGREGGRCKDGWMDGGREGGREGEKERARKLLCVLVDVEWFLAWVY
jgi:hypothetical protein